MTVVLVYLLQFLVTFFPVTYALSEKYGGFSEPHLKDLRNRTKSLFYHGFNSYMAHGFPYDEVDPLTCEPASRDYEDIHNTWKNDAMGNFSLTLFDTLDAFVVLGDKQGFERNIQLIRDTYQDFDIDANVQVFETTIRVLGGLLSAHLYASDERRGYSIENYDGFLLRLAYDLGKRLVLASENKSGVPYPRTNLRYGPLKVPKSLQKEQCTAGITSLILEFGLLSRLTNDPIFELISRKTFLNMWSSKTVLGLLPMTVDARSNIFTDQITGVGASIDSFYEYALKYSILFDDEIFNDIWQESYKALLMHSQNSIGIFTNIHVSNAAAAREWIDALGAFFPGLLVLAGDLKNAFDFYTVYFKLWNTYGAIPERWDFSGFRWNYAYRDSKPYHPLDSLPGMSVEETKVALMNDAVLLEWYPLRPEFVESTYFLYRATKDPFFLRVGEAILQRFEKDFRAPCGFAGIDDIRVGTRQARMESFVLSETLKYLYLLFDPDNDLHTKNGAAIFSTEAHPFWFDDKLKVYNMRQDIAIPEITQKGAMRAVWDKLFVQAPPQEVDIQFAKLRLEKNALPDYTPITLTERMKEALDRYHVKYPSNLEPGKRIFVNPKVYQLLKPYMTTKHSNRIIQEMNMTLDPDYLGLSKCQVFSQNHMFMRSKILQYPMFYRVNGRYQVALHSPPYYRNTTDIEIDGPFYDLFGTSGMISFPTQSTEDFDALIGSIERVLDTPIYRVVAGPNYQPDENATVPILPQDLYVPALDNLRMTFERLTPGKIDRYGQVVEVDQYNCSLRLLKINGCNLDMNDIVWVDYGWLRTSNPYGNIGYTQNGFLTINQELVANVRIVPD
ncbi:hypothetical protein KL906_001177 [Ogataea polymorpha]|nr:hypothetical protein KL906_001177 [Ogataea polymorpha]